MQFLSIVGFIARHMQPVSCRPRER